MLIALQTQILKHPRNIRGRVGGKQKIPVINYHHLITLKILAARPQDKADVDILQKINRFRNNE